MGSSWKSEEIIILSDDEDDKDTSCIIVEVEDVKTTDYVLPTSSKDEDVVVTFSRRADVLPHARYDCPIHPFTSVDCETSAPVADNKLFCDQCFCYICDKLASLCGMWCYSGACHCNSHNKCGLWNSIRNTALLGELQKFNLTLSEVDYHLRNAEKMLQNFRCELAALFSLIMLAQSPMKNYNINQQDLKSRYRPVFECVTLFLNKADQQNSRAAAILYLGAAEEFMRHFKALGFLGSSSTVTSSEPIMLLNRVISSLQRIMVMADITPLFMQKLQDFYQNRICLPAEMGSLKNSLCIRPWEDILLISVLRGQNVSGIRKDKGKKDILIETMSVVLLRAELLQLQSRYRELCRYLRVVLTDKPRLFQQIQDLIPFFKCKLGDFASALESLFPLTNTPISRFTPAIFLLYLRIFETATAPKMTVCRPEQLCFSGASWEPIKDAVPLKPYELVKFALKAQRSNSSVYSNSQCWAALLKVICSPSGSPTALPVPSEQFLFESHEAVSGLLNQQGYNIQIPRSFLGAYTDQALLLLITGALGVRILQASVTPALPVLSAFKDNLWAFTWLCQRLSSSEDRLNSFLKEITKESSNTPGSELVIKFQPCQLNPPSEVQP